MARWKKWKKTSKEKKITNWGGGGADFSPTLISDFLLLNAWNPTLISDFLLLNAWNPSLLKVEEGCFVFIEGQSWPLIQARRISTVSSNASSWSVKMAAKRLV
jgi:hypothetical protein